jgi:hypothetical protein
VQRARANAVQRARSSVVALRASEAAEDEDLMLQNERERAAHEEALAAEQNIGNEVENDRRQKALEVLLQTDLEWAIITNQITVAEGYERNFGFFYKLSDDGYPVVIKVGRRTVAFDLGVKPFWTLQQVDDLDFRCFGHADFQ